MNMRKVYITGVGCITPIGNDIETLWNNLVNGVCGIDFITKLDTADLPVKIAAEVKDFHPEAYGIDKQMVRHNDVYALYALAAAAQAMADSGLKVGEDVDPRRLGVAIGSGIGGIQTFEREHANRMQYGLRRISPLFIPEMIGNIAGGNVAITYNAQGPNLPVVTACATGTHSVGEAYRLIREGRADAVITGGAEAAVCGMAIGGFANMKALTTSDDPMAASLPFDKRRHGFVLGEGSGVLVLESEELAKKRGAKCYAEVCGYGNTCDAHHYTAPHPEGRGAAESMRLALEEAGYKAGENLYINAHGTGTPLNDKGETLAIKKALGEEEARRAVISSTKSMHGHMLGATGAVELIITALALKNGIVPPTIHLDEPDPECDLDYTPHTARKWQADIAISNTFGFGGQNATVALRKIEN
ncbi:MAG: beta-ketoacyl-ACP synthase II [Bacteroidales bacterium]|nr:beta-ketoacyl-ACP synthase II [Bacteroidales bacterium]